MNEHKLKSSNFIQILRQNALKEKISNRRCNNTSPETTWTSTRFQTERESDYQQLITIKQILKDSIKSKNKVGILFHLQKIRKFIGKGDIYACCPTDEFYRSGILGTIFKLINNQEYKNNIHILDEIFWIFCNCSIGTQIQLQDLFSNNILEIFERFFDQKNESIDLNIIWTLSNMISENSLAKDFLIETQLIDTFFNYTESLKNDSEVLEKMFEFFKNLFRHQICSKMVF